MPVANAEYWRAKINRNVERDAVAVGDLAAAGWTVHTIWECDLDAGTSDLLAKLNGLAAKAADARGVRSGG